MQENSPWTYQVDTYGLCFVVHTMLHNSYMEIDKKPSPDGGCFYLPNGPGCNNKKLLQDLRKSFQDYMCSDPQLIKKLSYLLVKQRASLCSA
ncbi:hypothetical protein COP1_047089 [Malus domestica]